MERKQLYSMIFPQQKYQGKPTGMLIKDQENKMSYRITSLSILCGIHFVLLIKTNIYSILNGKVN